MNLQNIKTLLLSVFGEKITAYIHGIRFYFMIKNKTKMDPESLILNRFLQKNDVAVDVGANGGDWTYRMSNLVGEHGHIYAFEADTYYSLATKHVFRLLGLKNITLFPVGLSDKREKLFLRVAENDGSRHNGRAFIDKNAKLDDVGLEIIQLETLDSYTKKYSRLSDVKLIKCDVEGYELFVFKGADNIIKNKKPVVILEVGHFERQGYTAKTLYNHFKQYGYKAFALTVSNTLEDTDDDLNNNNSVSVSIIIISINEIIAGV